MLINSKNLRKHPTFRAAHPIHSAHKFWIFVAVALTVLGFAWHIAERVQTGHWIGGSSRSGFILGVIAASIIMFEMLLAARKVFRTVRWFGRVKYWMSGHIWLGLACLPLALLHSGFYLGGQLSAMTMILMIVVIFSGVYGLYLQNVLPKRMLNEVKAETIYSQIDRMNAQNLLDAEAIVLATCGPPENQASEPVVVGVGPTGQATAQFSIGYETAAYMAIGNSKSIGKVQGKVFETRAPVTPVFESEPLRAFYLQVVKDFLKRGEKSKSPIKDRSRSESVFNELRSKLPVEAHEAAKRLESLCDLRRQFDLQHRLHRRLHRWLWVHLPLSWGLLILLVAHIVYASMYW